MLTGELDPHGHAFGRTFQRLRGIRAGEAEHHGTGENRQDGEHHQHFEK